VGKSPVNVPELLRRYGLHPNKRLGQNFLVDERSLQKIVKAAGISRGDVILEIGPGLGSLTHHLARAAQQVIAVELDRNLLPPLREVLAPFDNVTILQGDILEINTDDIIPDTPYFVVANIPYYITSALIRHLLEAKVKPRRIVLTVQNEVALRICDQPPKMSLLSLSVQVYGEPEIVARIPGGAFYPAPKVDSAVVRIDLFPHSLISTNLLPEFFQLIKAGFGQKRKTLRNTLSAGMGWTKDQAEGILLEAGIDPQRRAQTLSLAEWNRLTQLAVIEKK
jgi:16S rRNA (adenine1518-N6/adenine1519-N6)-dimethyltransferase